MLTALPLDEYTTRRAARAKTHARLARLDERISYGRLASVGAIALCAWAALFWAPGRFPLWSMIVPVAGFIGLAVWHDRVIRSAARAMRAITFYDAGIARLEDRWEGTGEAGLRFLDENHLYARDLDIFGPGSLFQLLSRARTHLGEELLARWLTHPAPLAIDSAPP